MMSSGSEASERCTSSAAKETKVASLRLISQGRATTFSSHSVGRRTRVPTLARLLKARDFDQIRRILSDPSIDSVRWIEKKIGFFGESSLYLLFKVSPPLDVVDAILDKLVLVENEPLSAAKKKRQDSHLTMSDCTGWTPFHVAVAFGCRFDVVSRLFSRLSTETAWILASTRDGFGRFPLHWACMPRLKSPSKAQVANEMEGGERLKIVQLLVQIYPDAVAAYDHKGFSPLAYATFVSSGLDDEAIGFLKKTREMVDDFDDEEDGNSDATCSFSFHDQVIELSTVDDDISVVTIPDDFDEN